MPVKKEKKKQTIYHYKLRSQYVAVAMHACLFSISMTSFLGKADIC